MAHSGTASNSRGYSQGNWKVMEMSLGRFTKDLKGFFEVFGLGHEAGAELGRHEEVH